MEQQGFPFEQTAAGQAQTTPPQPQSAQSPQSAAFAGFWVRYAAASVDALILVNCAIVIAIAVGLTLGLGAVRIANTLIGAAYGTLLIASSWQATVGMRFMKLVVVDAATGGRISYQHSALRYLAYMGPLLLTVLLPSGTLQGIIGLIGLVYFIANYITLGVSKEKTALHDILCKTRVLRRELKPPLPTVAVIIITMLIFSGESAIGFVYLGAKALQLFSNSKMVSQSGPGSEGSFSMSTGNEYHQHFSATMNMPNVNMNNGNIQSPLGLHPPMPSGSSAGGYNMGGSNTGSPNMQNIQQPSRLTTNQDEADKGYQEAALSDDGIVIEKHYTPRQKAYSIEIVIDAALAKQMKLDLKQADITKTDSSKFSSAVLGGRGTDTLIWLGYLSQLPQEDELLFGGKKVDIFYTSATGVAVKRAPAAAAPVPVPQPQPPLQR
jgi:uncharacterized RDD family membrane protein YckC